MPGAGRDGGLLQHAGKQASGAAPQAGVWPHAAFVPHAVANKPGFVEAMWCGDEACEDMMKDKAGLSSRCMPFEQEQLSDVCPCCGKPAKSMVIWGKAY